MFTTDETIYRVHGLTDIQIQLAKAFLKGAMYSWLKYHHNDENAVVAVRDLVGGNWADTPLQNVWLKHKNQGKNNDEAFTQAAIDAGWLLKSVLAENTERKFEVTKSGLTNGYRFVGYVNPKRDYF